MKINKCYLCKNDKYKTMYKKNEFTIVQCNNCEFVYVLQKPATNYIKEYYNNFDYKSINKVEKTIRKDAQHSCLVLSKIISNKSKIFDIGCGRGFFIDEAKKRGWDAVGIDSSIPMVRYAREVLHLNIVLGDIMSYKSNDKYDLVTLHQVIEHFNNPIKLLKSCYKIISKGGYIYIATPNIKSLSSRILKERFDHLIPPEHLSYFSLKTLKKALETSGFQLIYSGSWSYPADLGGIIKTLIGKKTFLDKKNITSSNNFDRADSQVSVIKKIKSFLFDSLFCQFFHPILNFDSWGTNLEIIAKKP